MTDQVSTDERRRDAAPEHGLDDVPMSGSSDATPNRRRFGRTPREQRISKWDRPPEPHDWRFYVGTTGKVLIATGLLMFGFVAYQLWGTGIETAVAQNRLEDRFDTLLAERDAGDAEPPPAASETPASEAESPDESDETDAPAVTTPSPDTTPPATAGPDITLGDVTAAVPVAVDLSDVAVRQEPIPQPASGEPLLRLEIPAIGRDDIVVPGVGADDLENGPGHYPDTPLPGQLGNAAIAGHRTTYGAPFFDVDQLESGDEIIATLLNGDRFVYEVTFVEIVSASDYWVVTTRNPDIAELTLTSCDPKYTARDRIIVHSVLNPEKSSNIGLPTFYTLCDGNEAGTIDGDDPVVSADDITSPDSALGDVGDVGETTPEATADTIPEAEPEATADESAGAEPEATADESAGAEPEATADESADVPVGIDTDDDRPRPVTDAELAEARAAGAGADPVDAFGRGWFGDRGAFLQIALWGLALVLVSFLARRVSRRYRRDSMGILVGVAPFVVALYFFYQNVNRLLPPGI